ncbi:hypothetical protein J1605_009361 [Eschrichtius robustus]|uniref:SH3 domain-containing protein n=1 Tax=Eschrichtius robustus TaxID=9764 RepID=A0AB34GV99_ESCRO|nr:hypothetical protein J1605_009361 [Eschrichtius robustus]
MAQQLRPQVPGKYTVTGLDEKGGPDALVLRSGDEVELVQEGDEGLWFVRNLSSGGEGWLPARKLSSLLGQRGAPGCLSSPGTAAEAEAEAEAGPGAGPGRAAAARLLVRRVQRGVRPAERVVQLQRELRGRPRGPAGVAPRPPRLRPWELASARAGAAWGGAGAAAAPDEGSGRVRPAASAPGPRPTAQEERGTAASSGSRTDGAADDRPPVQKGSRTPLRPRPQPLPFGFRRFWSGAFCRNTRSVALLPKEVTDSLTQRLGAGAGG